MAKKTDQNILVIGPSWVGDMVMSQSLYIALKKNNPDCRISVLAPGWTEPLLKRMPEVETSIEMPIGHGELGLSARRALGKKLRRADFSEAIVLPNSFKSALVPFHASIPKRTGWRGEWRNLLLNDCRRPRNDELPLMVQRFVALAYPEGEVLPNHVPYPQLITEQQEVDKTLRKFGLASNGQILAICPGAEFGQAKQWPAEYYAELSNEQLMNGWQVWIFGSANDSLVAENILADIDNQYLNQVHSLVGQTSLAEAIDLLSLCSIAVSNDSGLMHVAAALNLPVVGLFGSTSPDFTPPLSDKVKLLTTDIDCRPCFKRTCPYGHLKCLKDLKATSVVESVNALMLND